MVMGIVRILVKKKRGTPFNKKKREAVDSDCTVKFVTVVDR